MENYKIGLPDSIATVNSYEEVELTRIAFTHGGGMGGGYEKIYTTEKFNLEDKFITIPTNRNPRGETINTRYIVETEIVRAVKQTTTIRGCTENFYTIIPNYYDTYSVVDEIVYDPNREIIKLKYLK